MSFELELLRRFRTEDGAVDAASADAARSRLLAHIAATGAGEDGAVRAVRRRRRWPRLALRTRADVVALGLSLVVVIAVVGVFMGVGEERAPRSPAHRVIPHGDRPLILRNLAPGSPAPLPGQTFCDADLAPPGAIPGLGGARSGVIVVNAANVGGVNQSPFSITARGLAPTSGAGGYAVWITQVGGLGSDAVPLPGAKPRLLAVIVPGVGTDGMLAVEGTIPSDITGTYLVRITVQSDSTNARPGRTVLEGVGPL